MPESLQNLINQARAASNDFNFRYGYWVDKRKKPVDKKWLLNNLVNALGYEAVREFLKAQVPNEQV